MGATTSSRRRRGFDTRLIVGLLLVAASVAGVVAIVTATDRRVTVYAAPRGLAPGDRLEADDLVERHVLLDGAETLYLAPGDIPDDGFVVTRPVAVGELVPAAAAGSVAGLRATVLAIRLPGPVSGAVAPGERVDVWTSVIEQGSGIAAFAPPIVLVADATVVRVVQEEGFAATEGVTVEVLVPRSRIARILEAIANEDALAIVPAGLPLASR